LIFTDKIENGTPNTMKYIYFPTALIGLAALILIPYATKPFTQLPVTSEVEAQTSEDTLDVYLSRLAWTYECTGDCFKAQVNDQQYKRIDSNNAYSYGCLQFQQATYLQMAKKYKIDPWADGGIYNCDNQLKLARAMFLEDKKAAAQHWYTSVYTRGLGLPKI